MKCRTGRRDSCTPTGHVWMKPLHDPTAAPLPGAKTEVKTTTCYMCACRCGIRVHLRDGGDGPQVRYIEGNPDHPLNQGAICAKGSAGIMKQYSPARLTRPLRRKPGSERGTGEFERAAVLCLQAAGVVEAVGGIHPAVLPPAEVVDDRMGVAGAEAGVEPRTMIGDAVAVAVLLQPTRCAWHVSAAVRRACIWPSR